MIKNKINKKGISPIIATVLLIVIAIALFVLIFLWIRGFQGERIEKFGAPIENACPNIQLQINLVQGTLQIENIGSVPIHKIKIFEVTTTGTKNLGEHQIDLLAGSTYPDQDQLPISISCSSSTNTLKIIPVLLGTTESGAQKEYVCENKPIVISCS